MPATLYCKLTRRQPKGRHKPVLTDLTAAVIDSFKHSFSRLRGLRRVWSESLRRNTEDRDAVRLGNYPLVAGEGLYLSSTDATRHNRWAGS